MKKGACRKVGGSALTAALLVSVSVHAAGFAWFYTRAPEVQVASTWSASLSVVGSIEDLIAGSKEVVEPVEPDQPDEIAPHEIESQQPIEQIKEVETVEPTKLVKAEITSIKPIVTQAVKPLPVPIAEGVTIKAEIEPIKFQEEIDPLKLQLQSEQIKTPEVQKNKPVEVARILPDEQKEPAKDVDRVKLKEQQKAVKPEEAKPVQTEKVEVVEQEPPEELKPVEKKQLEANSAETKVAAVIVPVPRAAPPRPKLPQKARPEKTAKNAPPNDRNKPARKAGNSDVNSARASRVARRGVDTSKNGNNIAGSGESAGNAATSNYWGKVQTKIQRAADRRYPRREKNRNKSGVVRVSFVVHQNGAVTGIKLSRSSGNRRFDQAAMKAIKAAAPFPSFPSSMRNSTVSRIAPIVFKAK